MKNNIVSWLIFTIALSLVLSYFSYPANRANADVSTGLVGHWKFDEGLGTFAADSSGNNNTGTLINGPIWVDGKVGGAITFDGIDDYVTAPDSNSLSQLEGSNAATVAFWVKRNSQSSVESYVSRWGTSRLFDIQTNSGFLRPQWRYGGSGSAGTSIDQICNTACSIPFGTWTHLVITYSSPVSSIYINGQLKSSQNGTGGVLNTGVADALMMGRRMTTYTQASIDDVRIYSRALTASDVSELYSLGGGSTTPSPTPTSILSPTPTPSSIPTPTPTPPLTSGVSTLLVKKDGTGHFTTIQSCADVAQAGQTCLVSTGIYNEHVITKTGGTNDSSRVIFKAEGVVTMQGFDIKHPYVTIEGFDITGPTSYQAYITVYSGADYCKILNNTIRDGVTGAFGVGGISFYPSGVPGSNCVVRGNTLNNLRGTFITTGGVNNLFENNSLSRNNSRDFIRLFGNYITFRRNIFKEGTSDTGTGNHPDFIQTFGGPTIESQNTLFEENWIENLIEPTQFSQMNSSDGAVFAGILYDNIKNFTFRRNVVISVFSNANNGIPGSLYENNTFYRMAYGASGIGFGGGLTRGDTKNATLRNNAFVAGGSGGNTSGFYSLSGQLVTREVLAVKVTGEGCTGSICPATGLPPNPNGPIATGILNDLVAKGYTNPNGVLLQPARNLTGIDQFSLDPAYAAYKQTLYNVLILTRDMDVVARNSFYVNYNYVGGLAPTFAPKRSSECPVGGSTKFIQRSPYQGDANFCEPNGVNGGDPQLRSLVDFDGPDNIPFTLDDGLKPLPTSPLCGKGEGGTDIGAYSCDPSRVFAVSSAGGSVPTPTPTFTPVPTPTPAIDTTAPVISNILVSGITKTDATITWITNENSDSQVVFPVGPCPGATNCTSPLVGTLTGSHSINLGNSLLPGVTYTYQVKSRDSAGNLAVSSNMTFVTVAEGIQTPAPTPTPTPALTPGPGASLLTVKKDGTGNFTTIQACANAVPAGGVCIVYPGDYPEHVETVRGGTSTSQLVIKAAFSANNPQTAVSQRSTMKGFRVRHPYVRIEGFDITKYAVGLDQAHIRIEPEGDYCQMIDNVIRDGIYLSSNNYYFDGSAKTITNPAGGFIEAGFVPGASIYIGSDINNQILNHDNNGGTPYRYEVKKLVAVTDTTLTLDPSNTIFTEGPVMSTIYVNAAEKTGMYGITFVASTLRGKPDNCLVQNNRLSNLAGRGMNIDGDNHLIERNTFERMNGWRMFSFFGSNNIFRYNYFKNSPRWPGFYLPKTTLAAQGSGTWDMYDTIMASFDSVSNNTIFEFNIIEDIDEQFSNITEDGSRGLIIRNNVFKGYEMSGGIQRPGTQMVNNTFYKSAWNASHHNFILAKSINHGNPVDSFIKNNAFVETARVSDPTSGWYSIIGYDGLPTAGVSADYNFVAGAANAGYPAKTGFKNYGLETNGINGGNPQFTNLNNILGSDGLPFTLDDGLKPLPGSPLCGRGEGGTDIGAYSCDSSRVFAVSSAGGSVPTPTPTFTPVPTPTPFPVLTPTPIPVATPKPIANTPLSETKNISGTIVRSSDMPTIRFVADPRVYVVLEGRIKWIPSPEVFTNLGLDWKKVEVRPVSERTRYKRAHLLRAKNDTKVYYITEAGKKRWIPTEQVFNSYNNRWSDILDVGPMELDAIPEVELIRIPGEAKVYLIKDGIKTWIKTAEEFVQKGYKWNEIAPVNKTELDWYQENL